jgi:hypothetical protein
MRVKLRREEIRIMLDQALLRMDVRGVTKGMDEVMVMDLYISVQKALEGEEEKLQKENMMMEQNKELRESGCNDWEVDSKESDASLERGSCNKEDYLSGGTQRRVSPKVLDPQSSNPFLVATSSASCALDTSPSIAPKLAPGGFPNVDPFNITGNRRLSSISPFSIPSIQRVSPDSDSPASSNSVPTSPPGKMMESKGQGKLLAPSMDRKRSALLEMMEEGGPAAVAQRFPMGTAPPPVDYVPTTDASVSSLVRSRRERVALLHSRLSELMEILPEEIQLMLKAKEEMREEAEKLMKKEEKEKDGK